MKLNNRQNKNRQLLNNYNDNNIRDDHKILFIFSHSKEHSYKTRPATHPL